MNTNPPTLHHEPSIFGDPWNEPATMAVKVRTTAAVLVFLGLVFLFATTVFNWADSLTPEAATQVAASLPKANGTAGRAAQSPVPVLAPPGMTAAQAEEFGQNLRVVPDGYFSQVTFGAYDVVVNGSMSRSAADMSEIRISETETGLAAMFARAGADYLVEFSCRGPGSEGGVACITEAQARSFVESFAAFGDDVS